ncbi:MAG: hypothetical protein M1837_000961 [Sclerophora amabilis]|nr:MAG: hypothetical protein M1837_000961 [Sclerophora amabilis]
MALSRSTLLVALLSIIRLSSTLPVPQDSELTAKAEKYECPCDNLVGIQEQYECWSKCSIERALPDGSAAAQGETAMKLSTRGNDETHSEFCLSCAATAGTRSENCHDECDTPLPTPVALIPKNPKNCTLCTSDMAVNDTRHCQKDCGHLPTSFNASSQAQQAPKYFGSSDKPRPRKLFANKIDPSPTVASPRMSAGESATIETDSPSLVLLDAPHGTPQPLKAFAMDDFFSESADSEIQRPTSYRAKDSILCESCKILYIAGRYLPGMTSGAERQITLNTTAIIPLLLSALLFISGGGWIL